MINHIPEGTAVKFKGNKRFTALESTKVQAVGFHEMLSYYIEHPNGDKTKESIKHNGGFPDGFEQPHSKHFEEGKRYIFVTPDEITQL